MADKGRPTNLKNKVVFLSAIGVSTHREKMKISLTIFASIGWLLVGALVGMAINSVIYGVYIAAIPAVIVANTDRKSTRLNSSHCDLSRMPSSA